jgi:hypothetical protein
MKRLGAALILSLLATAALAQTAEYGRAGGDEVALPFKQGTNAFSGSLGFTTSTGGDFGSKGFAGTAGGALIADRLWFFATAQHDDNRRLVAMLPQAQLPAATTAAVDGKLIAQLGARGTFTASGNAGHESLLTTPLTLPSSLLSLRYTGIVSSNSFFTASVSSRRSTEPAFFTHW